MGVPGSAPEPLWLTVSGEGAFARLCAFLNAMPTELALSA
jgi:hypothetical protein